MQRWHLVAVFVLIVTLQLKVSAQSGSTTSVLSPLSTSTSSANQTDFVITHTAWDKHYFYIGIQVNKPSLHGTNSSAFSDPLQDDCAIIELQTDDIRTVQTTDSHSWLIAASAMGGFQIYHGADRVPLFKGMAGFQQEMQKVLNAPAAEREALRTALMSKIPRFQVIPHGTQLGTGAYDTGYTAEIAVPWVDIGGAPQEGTEMGFEVAAQSISSDSPPLISWSKAVTDGDTLADPALWGQIRFNAEAAPATAQLVVSPEVTTDPPVIDGVISPGEWSDVSAIEFHAASETSLNATRTEEARSMVAIHPVAPYPVITPLVSPLEHITIVTPQALPHEVMATVELNLQANPRLSIPVTGVLLSDGRSAMANHPINGVGPWCDPTRVDWWMRQLTNAKQAGINVLLPILKPGVNDDTTQLSLLALHNALINSQLANQEVPDIGFVIDLGAVTSNSKLTVKSLYRYVKYAEECIPSQSRFSIALSENNGGGIASPLFLYHAGGVTNLPSNWVQLLSDYYYRDFNHGKLLVLGSIELEQNKAVAGYFSLTPQSYYTKQAGGWITISCISPGYDPTVSKPDDVADYHSWRHGSEFDTAWKQSVTDQSEWVLINGWNNYRTASEIAPSMEQGYTGSDTTLENVRRLNGLSPLAVSFSWDNAPSQLISGENCNIQFKSYNSGTMAWGLPPIASPVAFSYRWMRNGKTVAYGPPVPVTDLVFPLHTHITSMLMAAVGTDGQPLPPGDYMLEIGLSSLKTVKSESLYVGGNSTNSHLEIPVRIVSSSAVNTLKARVINSSLPSMLETGNLYPVTVTLRNEGDSTWQKGDRISLRLYRATLPPSGTNEVAVNAADSSYKLVSAVPPGTEVTASINLNLVSPKGEALPILPPGYSSGYLVRYEVATPDNLGVSIDPTPVLLVKHDFGIDWVTNRTPLNLPAGKRLPVLLSFKNDGNETWLSGGVSVGYHWYFQDGTEYVFNDQLTPLTKDVAPGEEVHDKLCWLNVPPNNGTYTLVWDLKVGDKWNSTTLSSRANDSIIQQVNVIDGKLTFADLSKDYDTVGYSGLPTKSKLATAPDLAFPASQMPPFAQTNTFPCGIWQPNDRVGTGSIRSLSFVAPVPNIKGNNLVSCHGQVIDLSTISTGCKIIHLLCTSSTQAVNTQIELIFSYPGGQSEDLYAVTVHNWLNGASHPNDVAYMTRWHTTKQGPAAGALTLYHLDIPLTERSHLAGIQLPNAPDIKIAAITLEK